MKLDSETVYVKLPWSTVLVVLATVAGIKVAGIMVPLILPLLLAVLVGTSLTPLARWLESKKLPKWASIAMITVAMILLVAIFATAVFPAIFREAKGFFENLPQFRQSLLDRFGSNEYVKDILEKGLDRETITPSAAVVQQFWGVGNVVFGGFADVALVLILSIYLLAEGPRIITWVSAFFSSETQLRINETTSETSKIISAFVLGQFLSSACSFGFTFTVLSICKVPAALLLAALTGVLDILPVLGFILSIIPAVLFATSVSGKTALVVLLCYGAYHLFEVYILLPFIYGNRLRLSSFVVFFTLLASGLIGGIEFAILSLPIVASYPAIERIWLKNYIRKEAILDHSAPPQKKG